MDTSVAVIGAGPAGLATAACLRRRGIEPTVLDRGRRVGDSWRWRYDRLHLHTPRIQSRLPGLGIPRRSGRWVARDGVVTYLEAYAAHHGIEPRLDVEVGRVERDGHGWLVRTSDGELAARQVVVATGYNHTPRIPAWPGRAGYTGEILHASRYRNPTPYVGRDVLVVGTGNTGAEVAADLAESGAGRVRLAVRTPPNIIPRQVGAIPTTLLAITQDRAPAWLVDPANRLLQRWLIGDLRPYGMPAPARGVVAQFRATDVVPIIDVGLVEQLRAGRVEAVAAVASFERDEVVLADGECITPEVVIAATGYDSDLGSMLGHLGVLDDTGRPLVRGAATAPHVPGMRFVGLHNPLKGLLLQINLDSRSAARAISRELNGRGPGRQASTPAALRWRARSVGQRAGDG